ncbi:MAG: hypothetical protein ACK5Y6_01705 [Pseudomonadota bacterium]
MSRTTSDPREPNHTAAANPLEALSIPFRFTLRELLLGVAVTGGAIGLASRELFDRRFIDHTVDQINLSPTTKIKPESTDVQDDYGWYSHQPPGCEKLRFAVQPGPNGEQITPDVLRQQITNSPTISSFSLKNSTKITDNDLAPLERCELLEMVSIINTPLTGEFLKYIQPEELKAMFIRRIALNQSELSRLSALKNLRNLSLSACNLDDGCLPYLLKLTQVTDLNLEGNYLSGRLLRDLERLPRLEKLFLDYNSIQTEADLFALEDLNIRTGIGIMIRLPSNAGTKLIIIDTGSPTKIMEHSPEKFSLNYRPFERGSRDFAAEAPWCAGAATTAN